jgi:hypothetical protein
MMSQSELLYQEQLSKISFKKWLLREYSDTRLMGHPFWQLAFEIEAKWPDFPETGTYLDLGLWLAEHGACNRCKKAFRDAWGNYINDA